MIFPKKSPSFTTLIYLRRNPNMPYSADKSHVELLVAHWADLDRDPLRLTASDMAYIESEHEDPLDWVKSVLHHCL